MLNKIPFMWWEEKAGYKIDLGLPMGASSNLVKIRGRSYKTVYIKKI